MGKQLTGPTKLRNFSAEFPAAGSFYDTAQRFHWECEYADGLKMVVNDGRDGVRGGVTFEGEDGKWIHVNRGRLEANPKEILRTELKDTDERTYVSNNHVGNFIDCVSSAATSRLPRSRQPTGRSASHIWAISPCAWNGRNSSGTRRARRSRATSPRARCSAARCVPHGSSLNRDYQIV